MQAIFDEENYINEDTKIDEEIDVHEEVDIQEKSQILKKVNSLYKDVVSKLKIFSFLILILEILSTLFASFQIYDNYDGLTAVIVLAVGVIISVLSSMLLYAFAVLLDKVCQIEINTRNNLEINLEKNLY